MISIVASGIVAFLEKELIKHEPDIQAAIISQLEKGTTMLLEYFSGKISEVAPATKIEPKQE